LDDSLRQEAVATIPFDRLDAAAASKLQKVVTQPSIYRRLPVTVVDSDPDLFLFLVRYPEVVVNMWQLMGVTKVQVNRTGEFTLDAMDGAGTAGKVELVYGDRGTHVYYSEGAYEGPLFRRLISGRCVLVLKTDYYHTIDKRCYVTNRLDMFVQLDNIGADLLAKTLQPLVGRTADQNFVESSKFLSQVSMAAEKKADKLTNVAGRLNNVDGQVRDRFIALTGQVAERASQREELHFTGVENRRPTGDESLELRTVADPEPPSPRGPAAPLRNLR
jgi:hypothetical protein